jgi:hypothetical protein
MYIRRLTAMVLAVLDINHSINFVKEMGKALSCEVQIG